VIRTFHDTVEVFALVDDDVVVDSAVEDYWTASSTLLDVVTV